MKLGKKETNDEDDDDKEGKALDAEEKRLIGIIK